MVSKDYYDVLVDRLNENLSLSVDGNKLATTMSVITRFADELKQNVNKDENNENATKKYFSNFVNRALSSVEALGLSDMQYKAIRKMMLSDIYGCRDAILSSKMQNK